MRFFKLFISLSSSLPRTHTHTHTHILSLSLYPSLSFTSLFSQEEDIYRAQLIELNIDLVEKASLVIRSAVASAMDWGDIELLVKDAQGRGDPVALAIQNLKLSSNEITLLLRYNNYSDLLKYKYYYMYNYTCTCTYM